MAKVIMWRLLVGPAMIADGLVWTLTISLLRTKLTLQTTLNLARARCRARETISKAGRASIDTQERS